MVCSTVCCLHSASTGGDKPPGGAGKLDSWPATLEGSGGTFPCCPFDSVDAILSIATLFFLKLSQHSAKRNASPKHSTSVFPHEWQCVVQQC